MDNMIDHYQAVLRDLELRRSRCKQELEDLDNTINGIKKLLSPAASLFTGSPAQEFKLPLDSTIAKVTVVRTAPQTNVSSKYAGMSVRWAILKLLSEKDRMAAADITQALIDGGISAGKGKDFSSNVSAVLSDMKNKRREVMNIDGLWNLTGEGVNAWNAIKSTPQYQNRISPDQPTLQ